MDRPAGSLVTLGGHCPATVMYSGHAHLPMHSPLTGGSGGLTATCTYGGPSIGASSLATTARPGQGTAFPDPRGARPASTQEAACWALDPGASAAGSWLPP